MRRTLLSTFAAGALLLLLGGSAAGQSGGEAIHSYVVGIRILDDGDLAITETIDYDFGPELRHGIFRTIPTRFHYDDVSDRVYPIRDVTVESPTAPSDVEVSEEGGSTVIRVGDPEVEISGRHTYALSYRVEGALNGFDEHDELYWNAIGDEWQAPIERVRVVVSAPARVERVACFQGWEGGTDVCGSATRDGRTARFSAGRTSRSAGPPAGPSASMGRRSLPPSP